MRYVRLGNSGLQVSQLCLGAYSFGEPDRGHDPWTLAEEQARPIIHAALDAGVTFFDTANAYSAGSSEEILGRALAVVPRDSVVIATKLWARMRRGPNGAGLSRKAVLTEIDHSLRRLGTDHIDLWQIHRFDPYTPLAETLEALDDVVRAGKVRYLGASSMHAWQLATALHLQARHGWAPFIGMQTHYNLLYREEEREMLPLCADAGVGVVPWSPLARGRLTRDWDAGGTARAARDYFVDRLYVDDDRQIVDAVAGVATARGVPRAQVALAWTLRHPAVSATCVGATRPQHLTDAVAAMELALNGAEVEALESPYSPRVFQLPS